jgi:phosphatidylglycerophosphate synthase
VIDGLRDIHFGRNVKGLAKIATFAPLDVVDGKLAKKSGTASNKGAFYDAACDKAKVAGVLAVTIEKKYLPKSIASLILGQQAINSVITLAAMKDGTELKPTLAGKLNMAAIWATAGAFTFRHLLEKHATKTSDVFEAIGYSAATVVATLGAYATVGYIEQYEKGHLTHSQN